MSVTQVPGHCSDPRASCLWLSLLMERTIPERWEHASSILPRFSLSPGGTDPPGRGRGGIRLLILSTQLCLSFDAFEANQKVAFGARNVYDCVFTRCLKFFIVKKMHVPVC